MRRPVVVVMLLAVSAGCASLLGLEEVTPTKDADDGSTEGGGETGPLDVLVPDVQGNDASDASDASLDGDGACEIEYFTSTPKAPIEGAVVLDNAVGNPVPSLATFGSQSVPSSLVINPLSDLNGACGTTTTCTFDLRVTSVQTSRSVVWVDGPPVFRIDVESGSIYARTSFPSSVITLGTATADTFFAVKLAFPSLQQVTISLDDKPAQTMSASIGTIHLGSKPIPADSGTFPTYVDNVKCTRK